MIRIENVSKVYDMGRVQVEALRGVDLEIERGEYAAILGPSGSGKSTLMHILGCLDTPSKGQYKLDDRSVEKLTRNELAHVRSEKIGFVFQSFNLLAHATAQGNVELPLIYNGTRRRQRYQRAGELLERVGLGDRIEHRPSEMSGGQRQRVARARALATNPDLILADEPTGNLDAPDLARSTPDLQAGIKRALQISPEFKRAALEQKDLDLLLAVAADQARPALDLHTRVGLNGIGSSSGDDFDLLRQGEGRSLQIGVTFTLPLGQSAQRARLQQRHLEKERADIDIEALRRQLSRQVRDQHRQVQTSLRSSEVALLTTKLAARRVQEQEERLDLGLATVRQVLDAQDELAAARLSHQQAVLDYTNALLEWQRLTDQ